MRIGHGYDVHRLVEGRSLILGGVHIPFEKGLDGHSDADVLTHAVMDALLGAAAMGDIGKLFPDTDDRYLGADSIALLREVDRRLTEAGYRLGNLDVTVIAQRPKLAPYINQMRQNLAAAASPAPAKASPPTLSACSSRCKTGEKHPGISYRKTPPPGYPAGASLSVRSFRP